MNIRQEPAGISNGRATVQAATSVSPEGWGWGLIFRSDAEEHYGGSLTGPKLSNSWLVFGIIGASQPDG